MEHPNLICETAADKFCSWLKITICDKALGVKKKVARKDRSARRASAAASRESYFGCLKEPLLSTARFARVNERVCVIISSVLTRLVTSKMCGKRPITKSRPHHQKIRNKVPMWKCEKRFALGAEPLFESVPADKRASMCARG